MRSKFNKTKNQINKAGVIPWILMVFGLLAVGCSHQPMTWAPGLKVLVEEEGIYRISASQLAAAGMDIQNIETENLRLSLRGNEQSLFVFQDEGGIWLEFYGQKSDSLYTADNVYILEVLSRASDFTVLIDGEARETSATDEQGSPVYVEAQVFEENRLYFPQVDGSEHWYWATATSGQQQPFSFVLSEVAPGDALIRLDLWSNSEAPADPDHHLMLKVNDQLVLDNSWDGKGGQLLIATIPAGILVDGENSVLVEIPGDTGSAAEVSWINWYEVSYPRYAVATDEQLKFTAGNQPIVMSGFQETVHLFDISDGNRAAFELASKTSAGNLVFTGVAGNTYYAVGNEGLRGPVSIMPLSGASDMGAQGDGADYLVIGPEDFLSRAGELISHREAQGLKVMQIPLSAIYDQYNYGFPEPDAIRRFLGEATQNWAVEPKYVLLIGDASYDPKNYLQLEPTNILPTYYVQTQYGGQTASDIPFGDLDDDGIPDIAVGRLPANSADDVSVLIRKTLVSEYYWAGHSEELRLLAIADGQESGFQYDAQRFLDIFSPETEQVLFTPEAGVKDAGQTIQAFFSEDFSLVAYFGHGSVVMWGKDQLFTVDDAENLSNSHYPLVINMTCLTGLFTHPKTLSLSEVLLFNPSGGAVAVMAPTSLTLSGDQSLLSTPLGETLEAGNLERLGDIFLSAQRQMNGDTQGVRDVLATFLLFGDPGLVIFPKE